LLKEKFGGNEAIASTKTTIVLRTAKDTTKLPIKKSKRLKPGGLGPGFKPDLSRAPARAEREVEGEGGGLCSFLGTPGQRR